MIKKASLLIIGGGPAGLNTALYSAKNGISDIVLIDKKYQWGTPVQCAEYVPLFIMNEFVIPQEAIACKTDGIKIHIEGQEIAIIPAPGIVLNRDIWQGLMADEAAKLGVRTLKSTKLLNIDKNKALIKQNNEKWEIGYQLLVGADGPKSVVRKELNLEKSKLDIGLQYVLETKQSISNMEIFFSRKFDNGYGWIIPKGNLANVGVVVPYYGKGAKKILDEFVKEIATSGKIISSQNENTSGGFIPVYDKLNKFVYDNTLLIGDAAGHVNSITRAGIFPAIVCGRLAGSIAAKAIKKSDITILKEFDQKFQNYFKNYFQLAREASLQIDTSTSENFAKGIQNAMNTEGQLIQLMIQGTKV